MRKTRKLLSILLVLVLALSAAPMVGAAANIPDPAPDTFGAVSHVWVDVLQGNNNGLGIAIMRDGQVVAETYVLIRNNSSGEFAVGEYRVFVSTSGNNRITANFITYAPLPRIGSPILADAVATARIVERQGSFTTVEISVTRGGTVVAEATVTMSNNSAGNFAVGAYTVYVELSGNAVNNVFITSSPTDCLLKEVVYTVTMNYGIRLWGTPNEYNSLRYLESKFKEIGFAEEDVVFSWWPRSAFANRVIGGVTMGGMADAFTGRLAFDSGPDIYGTPIPNNASFVAASGAKIVPVGTHLEYAIPEGVTGNIIAGLIFDYIAPNVNIFNEVINELNAENEDVNIVGAIIARTGTRAQVRGNPGMAGTPTVPTVSLPLYWFNEAVVRGDDLQLFERYTRTHSGVTYAIQRAATDDPDAVIIVTAHIDSVLSTRGASDNAAGVAGVMETARRFLNVDNGNIKIIYALVGAEEGGGMLGAVYMAEMMLNAGKRDRTININGDMFGSPNPMPNGLPLDSISVHTVQTNAQWARYGLRNATTNNPFVGGTNTNAVGTARVTPAFNLASWLILNHAEVVPMAQTGWGRYVACPELIAGGATGLAAFVPLTSPEQAWIQNYRNNNFGSTDHIQFANRVMDATNIAIVNEAAHFVEEEYHNAEDTMALNYCYARNLNATNLMALGVQRAIELNISKRAGFDILICGDSTTITLLEYARLFNVYDRIEVNLICGYRITMSADNVEYILLDTEFVIDFIVARGYGIADHANRHILVMFSTLLDSRYTVVVCCYGAAVCAVITEMSDYLEVLLSDLDDELYQELYEEANDYE